MSFPAPFLFAVLSIFLRQLLTSGIIETVYLFFGVVAIFFGFLALLQIRKSKEAGIWQAVAGIFIGILLLGVVFELVTAQT